MPHPYIPRTLLWAAVPVFLLRADVCNDLPEAPADAIRQDRNPRVATSFRLSVHPGGPAFRVTLRPFSSESTDPNVRVHSGDIEVARCSDGQRVQVIAVTSYPVFDVLTTFHARDINFDGYLDLAVLWDFGGKWGSESWRVFDPGQGKFVQNELTRQLRELKAADYQFDPQKREISTRYLSEPWGCGGTGNRYRVEENRLVLVHEEAVSSRPSGCTVTVRDRVNGAMRVTEVRRFVDGKRVR